MSATPTSPPSSTAPGSEFDRLRGFLETHPAARHAAEPLSNGACVLVRMEGEPTAWHFRKEKDGAHLHPTPHADPDFELDITKGALEELLTVTGEDVGDFGVAVFERIVEKDPTRRVHVRLTAGLFTIMRHGYPGVLMKGGPKVVKWISGRGYGGMSGLKKAYEKLRHHHG